MNAVETDPLTTLQALFAATGTWVQLPLLLCLALLILREAPDQRAPLRSTMLLWVLGVVFLLLGVLLHAFAVVESDRVLRNLGILVLGIAWIRLSATVLFHVLLPWLRLTPPSFMEDVLAMLGYIVWCLFRLSETGVELSSIVTTSAVITAVLALSLQETLGNILGGMALQMDDSIRIGDWIQVGDLIGRVVDIRWRSISIETRNWETVVFPNSMLTKREFSILGRRTGEPVQWRRWIWFGVGLETSPRRVMRVIEEALARANVPNVATRPAPNCITMDINDSVIRYAVRYWLTDLHVDDPTDSAIRSRIYAALKRAGIQLAYPARNLHLISEDEQKEERQRLRTLDERVKLLRGVLLFRSLDAEELRQLAENLLYTPFVADDVVTRQGATAHWLYILVEGSVDVVLESEKGFRRKLARLEPGRDDSYFGEMGLLTGTPRAASVIAVTDVECYRLSCEGFERVLRERPAIAEEISEIIAERQADLAVAHDQLDEAEHEAMTRSREREILRSIRRFFHLED